jgi:hypothetical protein
MKNNRKQKLLQAITCLLCVVVAWMRNFGGEFAGGRVTGPLFSMFELGSVVFVLALLLTFVYPKIAAAIALAACLVSLPLYLFFIAPGPFRSVFKGEYTVPLQASLVWDTWAIAGVLALAVVAYVSMRSFSAVRIENLTNQG